MPTPDRLLFDTSPDEQVKKSKPRRQAPQPTTAAPAAAVEDYGHVGFLASISGHITCDRCGLSVVDLVDTRKVDGETKWLVCCGWNCLHSWLVDPIPGILDEQDAEQEADTFVVRGGRFDGMRFDQIAADGNRWYMELLVKKSKRSFLAAAAAEWLAKNP